MIAARASQAGRPAVRGRVVIRLRPGEDPSHVRTWHDVVAGAALPSTRVDGGPIDAAVRRFSPALRVTRAFHAAARVGLLGEGHHGWDDVEHAIGLSRTFGVEVDPAADVRALAAELAGLSVVESASQEYLCSTPFGPAAPRRPAPADPRWAHAMVGAAEALAIEPGDPATLVAVVDSGVRLEHPELRGHLRAGANAVSLSGADLPEGMTALSAAPRDERPEDDQGHGTGCAGIIGANGYEIEPGVAGACWIIPVKALFAAQAEGRVEPTAVGSLLDIDRAVKTAIDLGARVLNLSFGTPETELAPDDPVPHVEMVRYALARGAVLVAASGNSGDEVRYFPAALPGVIAVGAVGPDRRPSPFSTRGAHVCLCAPGEAIPLLGLDGYTEGYGTSFAAPFVAAACTLVVARGLRHGTALPWTLVRDLLAATASPFAKSADRRGAGAGILDVAAAVRAVDDACRAPEGRLHDPFDAGGSAPPRAHEPTLAQRAGGP